MSIVTAYALFADQAEAERIAEIVIAERLAACVNILAPCRSIYRWQEEIRRDSETPALFKTRQDLADRLIARIVELHSYDVPAVVVWPIERLAAGYGDWVDGELTIKGTSA